MMIRTGTIVNMSREHVSTCDLYHFIQRTNLWLLLPMSSNSVRFKTYRGHTEANRGTRKIGSDGRERE